MKRAHGVRSAILRFLGVILIIGCSILPFVIFFSGSGGDRDSALVEPTPAHFPYVLGALLLYFFCVWAAWTTNRVFWGDYSLDFLPMAVPLYLVVSIFFFLDVSWEGFVMRRQSEPVVRKVQVLGFRTERGRKGNVQKWLEVRESLPPKRRISYLYETYTESWDGSSKSRRSAPAPIPKRLLQIDAEGCVTIYEGSAGFHWATLPKECDTRIQRISP